MLQDNPLVRSLASQLPQHTPYSIKEQIDKLLQGVVIAARGESTDGFCQHQFGAVGIDVLGKKLALVYSKNVEDSKTHKNAMEFDCYAGTTLKTGLIQQLLVCRDTEEARIRRGIDKGFCVPKSSISEIQEEEEVDPAEAAYRKKGKSKAIEYQLQYTPAIMIQASVSVGTIERVESFSGDH